MFLPSTRSTFQFTKKNNNKTNIYYYILYNPNGSYVSHWVLSIFKALAKLWHNKQHPTSSNRTIDLQRSDHSRRRWPAASLGYGSAWPANALDAPGKPSDARPHPGSSWTSAAAFFWKKRWREAWNHKTVWGAWKPLKTQKFREVQYMKDILNLTSNFGLVNWRMFGTLWYHFMDGDLSHQRSGQATPSPALESHD